MTLEGSGDPQAVDMHVSFRIDGMPGILSGDVFDETLAAFCTAVEYQSVFETGLHPFLLLCTLVVRHGAADVFPVDVFFRDPDILHILSFLPDRMADDRLQLLRIGLADVTEIDLMMHPFLRNVCHIAQTVRIFIHHSYRFRFIVIRTAL